MVPICHYQLLAALPVPLSHHNVRSVKMAQLALPAIPVIIWPTPPLASKVYSSLTALITRKVRQPVFYVIQVIFYRQAPPAQVARLLIHIVPSALLLLLAFNVLVAIIYQDQLLAFFALP
jgi:hypothetical protein